MSRIEDFKSVRRIRTLNLIFQIALGLILFLGLNFLAATHFLKFDFSDRKQNSLSPESIAYIKNLKNDVEIFVTMQANPNESESVARMKEISRLIRQYEYESKIHGGGQIFPKFIDTRIENKKTEALALKYGKDIESCVIISLGKKSKKLTMSDFYESGGENKTFKGEQAVTSAILNVSSQSDKKIYFLKGHGEMSSKSSDSNRGLSEFAKSLENVNIKVAELDLNQTKQIPEDANMIIIASPQAMFLPRELDILRKYLLNGNGRMMILLDSGLLWGLEDLLFDWSLRSDDMLIVDTNADYESAGGDLIARGFPKNYHPIVRYLIDLELPVQFGSSRPVREDISAPIDRTLSLTPIILSSPTSWAEKNYLRTPMKYEEEVDLQGPIPIGMLASRKTGGDLGLEIKGGRLIVFGDESFISNKKFDRLGNSKLILNAVNWMFDDDNLLNIPPRKLERFTITISKTDIENLMIRFMILPAIILSLGIITYFLRRH